MTTLTLADPKRAEELRAETLALWGGAPPGDLKAPVPAATVPTPGSVLAPDIRHWRGEVTLEDRPIESGIGYRKGSRVQDQLARMLARAEINQRQHDAGTRLARDVERTGATIPSILAGEGRGNGRGRDMAMLAEGYRMFVARQAIDQAMKILAHEPLKHCVLAVACFGVAVSTWARAMREAGRDSLIRDDRDGIVILRLGLDVLAAHYGVE